MRLACRRLRRLRAASDPELGHGDRVGHRRLGGRERQRIADVGLAVTGDTAIARVHDPIFVNVEGTFGFSFR